MKLTRNIFRHHVVAGLMLLLAAASLHAQEIATIEMPDVPGGTPGLGAGFRSGTTPYKTEGLQSIDVVPLYLWESKYFYANGSNVGVRAINNDTVKLDAVVRYSFMQLEPDRDKFFETVDPREQAWEAGLQGALQGDWGQFRLGYYRDVSSTHKGGQWDVAYRKRMSGTNWVVSPYVAGMWMDSTKTNYYFGVSPEESRPDLQAYTAGSSLGLEAGVNTSYRLTDHWFVYGNVGLRGYDSAVTDSPLVDKSVMLMAYAGGGYMFGDNLRRPFAKRSPILTDWSWRVNYGYQSHSNIFPRLMGGQIRSSDVADTNIAGFTFGKIMQKGKRFDFWGKLAAFRHLEKDYQDDFWSFSAYMTAMGKGYSPWSEDLLFRYGVSMGLSYAQEVPITEQIKQEDRGELDNQLLNYLEFQVDFPVDRWVKSRFTNGCFVGMTVVHRSGMFGNSDILGSVAGGSDWVTLSYECVK